MSVSTAISVPITFHPKTTELLCQRDHVKDALINSTGAGVGPAEKALLQVVDLCQEYSHSFEPIAFELLPQILALHAHKKGPVAKAAQAAAAAIIDLVTVDRAEVAVALVKDVLVKGINAEKFQSQQAALIALTKVVKVCGVALSMHLDEILPVVSSVIHHIKAPVKAAARECIEALCATHGNRDIQSFVPKLVSALINSAELPEAIHGLASTTFVQQIELPPLAVIEPLLVRALRDPATKTDIKRKVFVIVDNMCKLIDEAFHCRPFEAHVLTLLDKAREEISDPEARDVAARAYRTLNRLSETAADNAKKNIKLDDGAVSATVRGVLARTAPAFLETVSVHSFNAFCVVAQALARKNLWSDATWTGSLSAYVTLFTDDADTAAIDVRDALKVRCEEEAAQKSGRVVDADDEDGEELCDTEFSLAYGAMTLLVNTRLRLMRGKRYGIVGPNGSGKSTLLRAIVNNQVEGFPAPDVLRTIYLAHDIDGAQSDMSVVEFLTSSKPVQEVGNGDIETCVAKLDELLFTKDLQRKKVGELSGGWKMKLSLAEAILRKADILMLDEPTNHLDVSNVAWLENYLCSLTDVTTLVVSHDSGFLDNVCTNIIHYEERKLVTYRGNLAEFIKFKPEAKSYYDLAAVIDEWTFPQPGFLDGVKSKGKAILKMSNVSFQYPGSETKQVDGVTLGVSLGSRVSVVGPNGAGKSTCIKLLTGELKASSGTVWKNQNMRLAYVAQHAFHHIEELLHLTPVQYILQRYEGGVDKEDVNKLARQVTDEEAALQQTKIEIAVEGAAKEKRVVERIVQRRKAKQSYEYLVKWVNKQDIDNTWMLRDKLLNLGFRAMILKIDEQEAVKAGLMRPLVTVEVEKHLKNLGLDPEFATHNRMQGLSGGQKVKVVLAAATWNLPHVIVLDEPTNYLDRDSQASLTKALHDYNGGVLIISHHRDFTDAICREQWVLDDGKLKRQGELGTDVTEKQEEGAANGEDEYDANGNKIKRKKKLSVKQMKQKKKDRLRAFQNGEELSEWSQDELF